MPNQRYLISDIGGTNIRVASFITDPLIREMETTYRLDPASGKPFRVLDALKDYRDKSKFTFTAACLGVAGRVKGDQVQITNRPDLIQRDEIAAVLGIDPRRVRLVNDMPPHLASVDRLSATELIEIKPGAKDDRGMRGIIMPGTGVGTGGAIYVDGHGYHPFPSEGGHIDFAPRDQQQDQLLRFLRPLSLKHNVTNVSNEFVFSGEGIRRIYTFLQNPNATEVIGPKSEEITLAVTNENLPGDDVRVKTVELYLKVLAAAAGNLALTLAATGGIYLGGSICLTLRKQLTTPAFIETFLNSGPPAHRPLLEEVPVRLIDYKDSGLLGAGVLALGLAT